VALKGEQCKGCCTTFASLGECGAANWDCCSCRLPEIWVESGSGEGEEPSGRKVESVVLEREGFRRRRCEKSRALRLPSTSWSRHLDRRHPAEGLWTWSRRGKLLWRSFPLTPWRPICSNSLRRFPGFDRRWQDVGRSERPVRRRLRR
jgi:hypothetical protein